MQLRQQLGVLFAETIVIKDNVTGFQHLPTVLVKSHEHIGSGKSVVVINSEKNSILLYIVLPIPRKSVLVV